jgi:Trypsin-like peptidase domain
MKRAAGLLAVLLLPALLQAQVVAYDYSSLYEQVSPAVVTVMTDDGSGSGFLASSSGLIATNHHVVRNTRYLAVQFADGRKVEAKVVAVNPFHDMALLKVNSEVVSNIKPLPILPADKEDSIRVGIPVVAIGSPLNQKFMMTQGILSKVDSSTVLGDFLLQPGNSGGPLLNRDGEVIGINTFGEANIAGAIRIATLREFLESPELVKDTSQIEPSTELLPSVVARYPVEILNRKIETEPLNPVAYRMRAGDFMITAVTPVLIAKLQVAQEKIRAANRYDRRTKGVSDPTAQGIGDTYYEWHGTTEAALDYTITFDVRPMIGPTKRSRVSKLSPLTLFGHRGQGEVEFKAEFMDLRIYRDGQLIQPILPGRAVIEGNDAKKRRFIDQAYAGSYSYSPDDFQAGSEFRIQIIDARRPDAIHKELVFTADSPLIQQLRSDFSYGPHTLMTRVH